MRISPFKVISGLVAAAALLLSFGTSAVLAKEGVSVNLLAPLPGDAAPGTVVPADFTMSAIYKPALQITQLSPWNVVILAPGTILTVWNPTVNDVIPTAGFAWLERAARAEELSIGT